MEVAANTPIVNVAADVTHHRNRKINQVLNALSCPESVLNQAKEFLWSGAARRPNRTARQRQHIRVNARLACNGGHIQSDEVGGMVGVTGIEPVTPTMST